MKMFPKEVAEHREAASAVMQVFFQTVVVQRELNLKANFVLLGT